MMLYAVALSLIILGFREGKADDKKLLAEGIKSAAECAVKHGINLGVCMEMSKEGADFSDPKFKTCKCWIPCVAKKMKLMTSDDKWDMDTVKSVVGNIQTPEWKAEAEKVVTACKDTTGKGCDAGFNAFLCGMKNSPKAKAALMNILAGRMKH